jgi:hypothetical protein
MTVDNGCEELRAAQRVFGVRLDGEALLWDDQAEQLHRLNPMATLVWDALADWSSAQLVSERLAARTQLSAEDVERCIAELRGLGLTECRVGPTRQERSNQSSSLLRND